MTATNMHVLYNNKIIIRGRRGSKRQRVDFTTLGCLRVRTVLMVPAAALAPQSAVQRAIVVTMPIVVAVVVVVAVLVQRAIVLAMTMLVVVVVVAVERGAEEWNCRRTCKPRFYAVGCHQASTRVWGGQFGARAVQTTEHAVSCSNVVVQCSTVTYVQ